MRRLLCLLMGTSLGERDERLSKGCKALTSYIPWRNYVLEGESVLKRGDLLGTEPNTIVIH